jgi:hypothetical protein
MTKNQRQNLMPINTSSLERSGLFQYLQRLFDENR